MRTHAARLLLLFCSTLIFAGTVFSSENYVSLAATGRFDLLERVLEPLANSKRVTTRELHALCFAYSKTKRYDKLLACLTDLEDKIKSGDRRTLLFGLDDGTPSMLNMKAEALIDLGQYEQASHAAQKASHWLKENKSDDIDMVATALAHQVSALALSGRQEEARKTEQELTHLKLGLFSDYRTAKAMAVARARMSLKDYQGVITAIESDSTFGIHVFLDRLVSGGYLTGINNWAWVELPRAYMLSKALLETGHVKEAKSGIDQLLNQPQALENKEIAWMLLADRAQIAENEGIQKDALNYYRQAIDIVEKQRASINTETSKIGFVGDKQELYLRTIALAHDLQEHEIAYEYMERSKSRALVDLLATRLNAPLAKLEGSREDQLLSEFNHLQSLKAIQHPLNITEEGLRSIDKKIAKTAEDIRRQSPELASLITVGSLPINETLEFLHSREVLLEFFGYGDNFYGVAIKGGNNRQGIIKKLGGIAIEKDIRRFREQIGQANAISSDLKTSLYHQLIAPFSDILGDSDIAIVPHGILNYLPFAALHDGKEPIIAKRSLRILPSASSQKFIRYSQGQPLGRLLLLGNPDLGDKNLDLPNAEKEVQSIKTLAKDSLVLIRKQATETAFKRLSQNFRFIHIASHGQFRPEAAIDSRLVLASDHENDGSLTVGELYDLKLDADLVTLSGCETGLGKISSGDDLIGLTRGFFFAGTSNLLASLWEVDDEASELLMNYFYQELKKGVTKKEALRKAQLHIRESHPEPLFWAAFYITGRGK